MTKRNARIAEAGIVILLLVTGCTVSGRNSIQGRDCPPQPDLQHFNAAILGRLAEQPVRLLMPSSGHAIQPETISVDIEDGRYLGATVRYPSEVTLQEGRESLNRLYKKHEMPSFSDDEMMGLWRNEDEEFSIQLTRNDECLRVIYIAFHEFDVCESIREAHRQMHQGN